MLQVTINKEVWDNSRGFVNIFGCPLATAVRQQIGGNGISAAPNAVFLNGIRYSTQWDYPEYCTFAKTIAENPEHSVTLTLTPVTDENI